MSISTDQKAAARGFTLLELMTTLAVLAILLSIAIPSYQSYIGNQQARSAAFDLMVSLKYARSEAIKRNTNAGVAVKAIGGDWANGWVVTTDTGKAYNAVSDCAAECLKIFPALPTLAIASDGVDIVTYGRAGRPTVPVPALNVCDNNASAQIDRRRVSVSLSGNPRVTREGGCDA